MVFHDVADVPADLLHGRRPAEVIAADEHRHAEAVTTTLRDRREAEVLLVGTSGDPVASGVSRVDLRRDDVRDIRVAKVSERALQEVRRRDVIAVHLADDVVGSLVLVAPRVEVPGLGPSRERAGGLVVALDPMSREVADAVARGHLADARVVLLVKDPEVDGTLVANSTHARQRRFDSLRWLLRRDDGREDGDT